MDGKTLHSMQHCETIQGFSRPKSKLWASLIQNGIADSHEYKLQFSLTLLDSSLRLTRVQNKKWRQKPLKKRGDTERPYE